MDVTLRIISVRDSEDGYIVSAASLDHTYPTRVVTLSFHHLTRLLDELHLPPDHLADVRAHLDGGTHAAVLTDSEAFEEALAVLHEDASASR